MVWVSHVSSTEVYFQQFVLDEEYNFCRTSGRQLPWFLLIFVDGHMDKKWECDSLILLMDKILLTTWDGNKKR